MIPAGEAEIRVVAKGFQPALQTIDVKDGASVEVQIQLEPAAVGQLRGLVRSFHGYGIRARVHVKPSGADTRADASGNFTLDVPPGDYEVVIEAKGYRTQRRKVRVEKDGVTVLNADMYRGK